jgi:hypothetical protein
LSAAAVAGGVAVGLLAASAAAGPADVLDAAAKCVAATCTITATIRHADTGWDHYANRFEVVAPDGSILATRMLNHPHLSEQPFTRSLPGVRIPEGIERVRVRAGDSVHGLGGAEVLVRIERRE